MNTTVNLDMITHDPASDEYVLYLIEDGPWPDATDDWRECLSRIQRRILSVVDVVTSDKLFQLCPQAVGKAIRVQVDSPQGQPEELAELIDAVRQYLASGKNDFSEAISSSSVVSDLRIVSGHEMGRFEDIANYIRMVKRWISDLAESREWQRAYRELPDGNLSIPALEAVIAQLTAIQPQRRLQGFELPIDNLPLETEAAELAECRRELFLSVFSAPDAQAYLLRVLDATTLKAISEAKSEIEADEVRAQRVELERATQMFKENESQNADAENLAAGRQDLEEKRNQIASVIATLTPSVSRVVDAIRTTVALDGACASREFADKLAAYCKLKERMMAKYFSYVALSASYHARSVSVEELGRVGLHALSMAIDTLSAKAVYLTPNRIMWWLDRRVQEAASTLNNTLAPEMSQPNGTTEPNVARESRPLQPEDGNTPVLTAKLVGRAITRQLLC